MGMPKSPYRGADCGKHHMTCVLDACEAIRPCRRLIGRGRDLHEETVSLRETSKDSNGAKRRVMCNS
jgi:hypothetical protein